VLTPDGHGHPTRVALQNDPARRFRIPVCAPF
jgi:hypothetical protein